MRRLSRLSRSPSLVGALALALLSASPCGQGRPFRFDPLQPTTPSGALLDLDGDGVLDAVGNGAWRNDGHGNFTRLPNAGPLIGEPVLGDVDGDGDIDVLAFFLVGDYHVPERRLLLNDGFGKYSDASAGLPVWSPTYGASFGDVDGDGDQDLLLVTRGGLGGSSEAQDELWLNDGTGTFVDATSRLPVGATLSTCNALGDVDGDGDLDAVIGVKDGAGGDRNQLWLNDGAGNFVDATTRLPALDDATEAVALADVDADGNVDVIFVNQSEQHRLLLGDGAGGFREATHVVPQRLDASSSLALGDFDGDADVDVLFDSGLLWRNEGRARFVAGAAPAMGLGSLRDHGVGDADGDGDLDVLTVAGLWLNDGAAGFGTAQGFSLPSSHGMSTGDLDGDGHHDVLDRNGALWVGDGAGHFSPSNLVTGIPVVDRALRALGDFDGDGALDVIDCPRYSWPARRGRLFLNDGAGRFRDASSQLPPDAFEQCTGIEPGDVDGDGDLDLLFADPGNWSTGQRARNRLWLNDGTGRFSDASQQLPPHGLNTESAKLGDVDGDGDLDVVVASRDTNHLWLNGGQARFTEAIAALPSGAGNTRSLALGDVDGDGDLDVVLARFVPGRGRPLPLQDKLWLGDGAGGFTDATARLPQRLTHTFTVELIDMDGDGDLDVLGTVNLLRNDGTGRFEAAGGGFGDWYVGADFDGDGDHDVVTAGAVHLNLTRHLASRQMPRPGRPLTIEVFGEPGQPWVLCAAPRAASLRLPGLGMLRLDSSTTVLVDSGLFDGAGDANLALNLPPDRGLVRATLHWQALVAGPLRLTNAWKMTVQPF